MKIRQRVNEEWVLAPDQPPSFSVDLSMNHHEDKQRRSFLMRQYRRLLIYMLIILFIAVVALVGKKEIEVPDEQALYIVEGGDQPAPAAEVPSSGLVNERPEEANTTITTSAANDPCAEQWRPDQLEGQCFGLEKASDFTEKEITSAAECKSLCCELGDKCVTWQWHSVSRGCRVGKAVRLGFEVSNMEGMMIMGQTS